MEIHVISERTRERELWTSLLSNAALLDLCVIGSDTKLLRAEQLSESELLIFISDVFNENLQNIIKQCLEQDIPVLCVTDEIQEDVYSELIHNGVKGLLNSKKASLDIIKTAMRVVIGGGTYLERPLTKNI